MIKEYFPNLNGLRFFAALLVVVYHIELTKDTLGMLNFYHLSFVSVIGRQGVLLFFVLSGFLITYLLMVEEKKTGSVAIKNFYIRRMLRIFPLYYLLVLICFFVLPYVPFFNLGELTQSFFENTSIKFLMFMLFLPNLAFAMFPLIPYASQSWSIGVEEQFYLIWPLLLKKIKRKQLLFYGVIFFSLIIKISFKGLVVLDPDNTFKFATSKFINGFSIGSMAIGGLLAYFYITKSNVLKYIFSKYTQYTTYLLLLLGIGFGIKIPIIYHEFYSVLYGIVIINLATNKNTILNLENRFLNYLGKISYGIYMYHLIAIVITLKALAYYNIQNTFVQYFISIGFSVLISSISYTYFESYFIKKKITFSKIISGDNISKPYEKEHKNVI